MFGMSVKIEDHTRRVETAAKKAAYRNLSHAAASISKAMKESIETSNEPSPVGSPPNTRGRGGHNLKGAIRYDANDIDAVIGPIASFVGEAGAAHEFGGEYRGTQFPERPFAGPALEANIDRFAAGWAGEIGS